MSKYLEAIAVLVGTVIGAGILGIPYVVAKSGFLTGIIDIIVLGVILLFTNLYFGEITLRTKGDHQLTGYAKFYLGNSGKNIMLLSMIFIIYGAIIAYIIGVGSATAAILGGSYIYYSLIFFVFGASMIFIGLKAIERSELIITSTLITLIVVISLFLVKTINPFYYTGFDLSKIFLPYGVILFSFLGLTAIPQMKMILKDNEKRLKSAIVLGSLIPIIVYIIFAIVIVGVVGITGFMGIKEKVATVALSSVLGMGNPIAIILNIIAIFTMTTSFLALGLALKQAYNLDYKIKKTFAWLLSCFIPLIVFLLNIRYDITSFIKSIEISGTIFGGLMGVLVIIMGFNAVKYGERKPEYNIRSKKFIGFIIAVIFTLGVIYEILKISGIIRI